MGIRKRDKPRKRRRRRRRLLEEWLSRASIARPGGGGGSGHAIKVLNRSGGAAVAAEAGVIIAAVALFLRTRILPLPSPSRLASVLRGGGGLFNCLPSSSSLSFKLEFEISRSLRARRAKVGGGGVSRCLFKKKTDELPNYSCKMKQGVPTITTNFNDRACDELSNDASQESKYSWKFPKLHSKRVKFGAFKNPQKFNVTLPHAGL